MKILLVCTGNTCRSPMACCYLRSLRPEWEVCSAGTRAVKGALPSRNARRVMADAGLDLSAHRATRIAELTGKDFDQVFAMSPAHLEAVEDWGGKLLSTLRDEEVAVEDPYGGSLEVYRNSFEQIRHYLDVLKKGPAEA